MARNLMNFNPFNALARFDPFQRFNDIFGDARFTLREMTGEPRIRMDVTASDQAYSVKADMPGVKKDGHAPRPILAGTYPLSRDNIF